MRRNCCSHCGPKSRYDVHHAWRESHLEGNQDGGRKRRLGEPQLGKVPELSGSLTWKLGLGSDNLSRARPSQPVSGWDGVRPIPLSQVACLPQRASEQNGSCLCSRAPFCVCLHVCVCVCVCVCESAWVSLCESISVCVLREQGHLGHSPQAQKHLQNTLPGLQLIF